MSYWSTGREQPKSSLKKDNCALKNNNFQNEAIVKQIQIRFDGTNLATYCWSFDQYILWIPQIWKCNPFGCFCYPRCLFGLFSHHCLPLLLFDLHLSSWVSWSLSTAIPDTNYYHCDLYRLVTFFWEKIWSKTIKSHLNW